VGVREINTYEKDRTCLCGCYIMEISEETFEWYLDRTDPTELYDPDPYSDYLWFTKVVHGEERYYVVVEVDYSYINEVVSISQLNHEPASGFIVKVV